ncbi:MBL fold metallo-hydrolase [Hathewaya histolytica]|uniref:Metal-dependent hydrolase, beta-lactamase superfamily I n=1 Tax=Hathewaya histolytica TaxID=1498 RepID=A0A4U9RWG0_HATHI|nr:MBL fold metallo-hydrolase [Hathewaya histolytica]VTQ96188.1 metal-dependent hydrolase, beta-lactamase superfamily I [Hathewaya histolytica]
MIFCPLYSGSSGNSIFVGSEKNKILIDVGLPGKNIDSALSTIGESPKDIKAIFITHEHSDHIKGAGVLSRKYNIPIYANEETWRCMYPKLGKLKEENIKILDNKYVEVGDLSIENYAIPHDAASPVGYAVYYKNKKVCIATDLGYFTEEVDAVIKDSDVVLLESNHDVEMLKFGPYPYSLKRRVLSNVGHLSNDACGEAIVKITNGKPKKIYLGHLSKTNNYPDLAYKTVENILLDNGIKLDKDVFLTMANRDKPSEYITF